MKLTSDNTSRPSDSIEVTVDGSQNWVGYNSETGKHDKFSHTSEPNVVLCINEWEQVTLEREKVILLIAELQKLIEI